MATDQPIPEIGVHDIVPGVDTEELDVEAFYFYGDKRPIVSKEVLLGSLRHGDTAKQASRYAIQLFTAASSRPDRVQEVASDFLYEHFGYNVQDGGSSDAPLFIRRGVHKVNDADNPLAVVELSPRSCDQFIGVFLSEIHVFPPFEPELQVLADMAVKSYVEGAFTMALFEHFVVSRWLSETQVERDYKRYTRAAKKLMTELIGDNDFLSLDMDTIGNRLAGGVAYRRMMERLRNAGYFEDAPYGERIEKFRGKLALSAIRATNDDFFIGVASPLGEEVENAYIATAASMISPRSR